jgi:hypothetical protein
MKNIYALLAVSGLALGVNAFAQGGGPDHPSITVHGEVYTPRSVLARNMGTDADQTTQFRAQDHRQHLRQGEDAQLVPNRHAAGKHPDGRAARRNVRHPESSPTGFQFHDIKILLRNHAR